MNCTRAASILLAADLLCSAQAPGLPASAFAYDSSLPLAIREAGKEIRDGIEIDDITFASLTGGRTAAYQVRAPGGGKTAGILFVHWYAETPNANRTQFLAQAVELAHRGATSLLIETMWSPHDWFEKRDRSADYSSSIQQVKELRRALDVLLAGPAVDHARIAFVGHDFGAMYGAVLAGVDGGRVHAWALHAGTSSFGDWFLIGTHFAAAQRQAEIDRLAPLDPIRYIGSAAPAPVLFQFSRRDRYVPEANAKAFFEAAKEPKTILWYDADHALNAQAIADRQAWLVKQLRLR